MDRTRNGVSLTDAGFIDLHLHSTASDGELPPGAVVARAARLGLAAIALTDHDSLDGLAEAEVAAREVDLRIVGGCEFSVKAPWGELHVLGYFLSTASSTIQSFLRARRSDRQSRAEKMVARLQGLGVDIDPSDVTDEAAGGAVGRPHVAKALVRRGVVTNVQTAFDRYLGWGRPAFIPKQLPSLREVSEVVHDAGGLVSAAHLKDRGTRGNLETLRKQGLDAVEVRHPRHTPSLQSRLSEHAKALDLLRTGGSDWHGDGMTSHPRDTIGSQQVPAHWLDLMERRVDALRRAGA